jgi:hypothetical protein
MLTPKQAQEPTASSTGRPPDTAQASSHLPESSATHVHTTSSSLLSHTELLPSHACCAHLISTSTLQHLLWYLTACLPSSDHVTRHQTTFSLIPHIYSHLHPTYMHAPGHHLNAAINMTASNNTSGHCAALASPNPFTVGLAGILVLGILVSYLPQHAKIFQRRSSEGLSPWYVLLGGLGSIAAVGNIMTLPASRTDIECCRVLSGGECAAALLGVAQIGVQWACFMLM